jgi:hypothetical protein
MQVPPPPALDDRGVRTRNLLVLQGQPSAFTSANEEDGTLDGNGRCVVALNYELEGLRRARRAQLLLLRLTRTCVAGEALLGGVELELELPYAEAVPVPEKGV